ncbi:methyl-accepting chemotaxis protein [Desulfosporosinus sp.]|uniref:methyl-accepting chemotaxis protein n=1 Tax=Desulfosporosinus sp. TaxID=157907 RepID=UPI0025BD358B|nr:methyl-accepting chemotaxis protein [Desulfosporosinus sp.]MBC2722625.1 CZB domain-containing protein [Desulfosporosinus sp.]MBC2726303.1 CZB domain-containing protein [Desulfosporosinus sp.]
MFKFSRDNGTDHNQASIDMDGLNQLTECLKRCDLSKPLELELSPSSPLYDVVKVINQLIEVRQNAAAHTMLDINGVVGQMTGMTSIREMLQRIQEQTPQIANMSAQAEEMGAAASETASSASNAASFVEQSLSMATSGVDKIQKAVGFVEHSFTEFEQVSKQVQGVLDSMSEIEQIVAVIAGVADQTNLLALNAAIEAARAGEQGRGFSVVADEVRKLAEHTKTSVTDIRKKIEDLSHNSKRTADSILSLSQVMNEGKSVMQGAGQEVEQILQHVETISSDIQQIAAGSQEQSAVVEEFAQIIGHLSESAITTEQVANQTGEGIYAISQQLGELRARQISSVPAMDNHHALELSKTDHLLWTWRIYNMLLGYEHVDPSTVGNHHDCRLGKWAESPENEGLRHNPIFSKLASPHARVHDLARQAALAYNQGNTNQASDYLAQMSQASQEVVGILEELQEIV